MSEPNLSKLFSDLVGGVRSLKKVPFDDFIRRLHNKARYNRVADSLFKYIPSEDPYPADDREEHEQFIDGLDADYVFSCLATGSIADAMLNVSEAVDDKGYRQYVYKPAAERRYQGVITSLMSCCMAEHINTTLRSMDQPDIHELVEVPGFKDLVIERLQTDHFIDVEVLTDITRGDHLFSISMLFIADYLHLQPMSIPAYGPGMNHRPSYQILQKWTRTGLENQAMGDPDEIDKIVTFCGNFATIVYCPTEVGYLRPTPTFDVMKSFYSSVLDGSQSFTTKGDGDYDQAIRDSLDRLDNKADIINEWESYCQLLDKAFRSSMFNNWNNGVGNAFSGRDWYNLRAWMEKVYNADEAQHMPPEIRIFDRLPATVSPTSFSPLGLSLSSGSQVLLHDGANRSVESVKKGDRLLALAKTPDDSGVSNEIVSQEVMTPLIGFNGESPFTTPSQVFYTTSGLRAVDPGSAKAVNPLADVGALKTGHIIYRFNAASEYEMVEIKSIEKTIPKVQTVYSIGLGEESRSFHVNGYLAVANDPSEILQGVTDMLQNIPVNKRLSFLASCKEMQGVFLKHDLGTIQQKLHSELFGDYKVPQSETLSSTEIFSMSHSPSRQLKALRDRPTRWNGTPLELVNGIFQLSPFHKDSAPAEYDFPEISVVDGRVLVDGEVQLRSTFDSRDRTFRWTRNTQIQQQNVYENGVFKLDSYALAGDGVISISSASDAEDLSGNTAYPFKATLIAPNQSRVSRSIELESKDSGVFAASGGVSVKESGIPFNMTFDKSEWPDNTDRDGAEDPMDGGVLWYSSYQSEEGAVIPQIKIPVLDDLRDQINEKFNVQLDPLYSSTVTIIPSDNQQSIYRGKVRFNRAPIVPFVSESGMDVNTFNVGFKSQLGIDITLPIFFSELYVDFNATLDYAEGALYEYDPDMRGMKGTRHYISGEYDYGSRLVMKALRSRVSHALAPIVKAGEVPSSHPELQPANCTKRLFADIPPSIRELIDFPTYNDQTVHNASQNLIQLAMYYHMDEDQRTTFTTQAKPSDSDLPLELRQNLPQSLKDFISKQYAPAFISRLISRQEKYKDKFTADEKKKIQYWWEGQGNTCLAKSKEYSELNNIASVAGMKFTYSDMLDKYFDDGPQDWAEKLRNALSKDPILYKYLVDPTPGGVNVVNRACCLMNTLAPELTFADDWFADFIAYTATQTIDYPYVDEDSDLAGQWLPDTMRELIERVLMDDPTLGQDIRDAIREDIEEFEKANGLDASRTAKERAANILTKSTIFFGEAQAWITAIGKGLGPAFSGTSLYKWLGSAFEHIVSKIPKLESIEKLKGAFSICGVVFYFGQVVMGVLGLVGGWDTLSDDQRATTILELLKVTADAVNGSIEAFKEFTNKPVDAPPTAKTELATATLDQSTKNKIKGSGKELANMSEDVNGEGTFRQTIADHMTEGGIPKEGAGSGEKWNEPADKLPGDLPPGGEDAAKKFSLEGNFLKLVNIFIGIGVTVAMTFSLVHDWDNLTTAGKIINTLSLITQGLTVLLDIVNFSIDTGLIVASGTLAAALPVIGAVLAVVGIILMIVGLFIGMVQEHPPPDPIQDFIDDTGRSLVSVWDKEPDPTLHYEINQNTVTSGSTVSLTITGKNNTAEDVNLTNAQISLMTGSDEVCLFTDDSMALVEETDPDKDKEGHVYIAPDERVDGNIITDTLGAGGDTYKALYLTVAGDKKDKENALHWLALKPGQDFKAVWTGIVNKAGSSYIELKEKSLGDKITVQFPITRL